MDTIGDVFEGNFPNRPPGIQLVKKDAACLAMFLADAIDVETAAHAEPGQVKGFGFVARVFPAEPKQFIQIDLQPVEQGRGVFRYERGVVCVKG